MTQRAEIVNAIQKAASLPEQAAQVARLDAFDREASARHAASRSIDLTDTVVRQTLTPVAVHERSTIATDWLGEVTASNDADTYVNQITAEAAMWFDRISPEVKADREEFTEQARGMARLASGKYGEDAPDAQTHFLTYVSFLHTQAASGLPQVQQTVDAFENSAPNAMPEDVLDNFAQPIHPINQGVSGTETSERAPLLQEIEAENGQAQTGTHHDTAQQFAGPPPVQATSMFHPSVAISHTASLDDFRREAAITDGKGGDCADCKGTKVGEQCGTCQSWKVSSHREAASGLPQVQQVVDAFENPARLPLPEEVAFPWEEDDDEEKKTAKQRRAAYVAGLLAKDASALTPVERREIHSFTASLTKQADEDTVGAPQATRNQVANTPRTTPDSQAGYAEGVADHLAGDAPTFSDNSSSVAPNVAEYSQGYSSVPDPQSPMLPPGAGGREQFVPTSQVQSARTAARKEGSLRVSASFTSPMEAQHPDFVRGYNYAARWQPDTRLVTTGSAEFEAGLYSGITDNPAQQDRWVGLHREAAQRFAKPEFVRRLSLHRSFTKQAAKTMEGFVVQGSYLRPKTAFGPTNCLDCGERLVSVDALDSRRSGWQHTSGTKDHKPNPEGGRQAKTAGTTRDLDTYGPGSSPSATGQTPINGPGTTPPLDGLPYAAEPGGPAPYNGAEPFGAPVVPGSGAASGTPTAIETAPGAPVDQAALQRLSPQSLAFRRTVQANLLQTRQGE